MRDRGTLIAGAGIALAFLVAGVAYLFFLRTDAAERHAEEARFEAEVQQQHVEKMQRLAQVAVARDPVDALDAGLNYLIHQQSPDGSWRSETYAAFKSGTALTPHAVVALQTVNRPGLFLATGRDPIQDGCDWLAKLVKPDGSIEGAEGDLDFPVYTAALTVVALSHPDQKRHAKARDAWLKFLLSHQLKEQNGWKPGDKQYGGWGYCRLIPKKPEAGAIAPPLVESNLSATAFALDALKAAAVKDHEIYRRAEQFLKSCQNPDGGFHFIYDDLVRNKAGAADGRFHSYGSATADGVRGLQICEPIRMKHEDETVKGFVARGNKYPSMRGEEWLEKHFRADSHPGEYIPAHESNRDAVYYYYAASASKLLHKPALATELAKRQQPDGSWANPLTLVREDEPLVATSHALIALANCLPK